MSDKKLNVQGKKDAADKEKSPEVILQEKDEQIASLDQRSKELKVRSACACDIICYCAECSIEENFHGLPKCSVTCGQNL